MKKRDKKKKKYNSLIATVIILTVVFLTTGFASFQAALNINEINSTVRIYKDIRVTNVTVNSIENSAVSNWEDYNIDLLQSEVSLPNSNSAITFTVQFTNIGSAEAGISAITGLPSNLDYTISNYTLNDELCDDNDDTQCTLGSISSVDITIGYATNGFDSSNTNYVINLNFEYCYFADAVAKIGHTYYNTLQAAINTVALNTPTTVELVKSTAECVEVQVNKNIVFSLGSNTLSNNDNAPVIWNYGTITISDGTITSNASTNGTINNYDGTVTFTGGNIINTGGRQALYNFGGTAYISGTAYFRNTTNQRAAVHNLTNSTSHKAGVLNITGGTIIGEGLYGVRNEATMTIGEQGGTPDRTNPIIQGYEDGIYSTTNYNFYDGIVKGRELALNPASRASTVESGYMIISSEETINNQLYKTAFLGNGYTVKFEGNGGSPSESSRNIESGHQVGTLPTAKRNGYTFDGWFSKKNNGTQYTSSYTVTGAVTFYAHWTQLPEVAQIGDVKYLTLENAIAAVPDSTPTTITLLKNTTADITITSDQYITIDLNGSTISNSGSRPIITTSGHLVVENGSFTTSAAQAAINVTDGTTEITDCSIVASGNKSRQAVYITGGVVTIDGSSYLQSQASGKPSGSNMERGTVQVIAGTLYIYDQVEIYASVTNAVSNEGTVIIGDDDGTIDSTNPILRGKMYGIKSSGTVSMYDGLLKGETAAYNPNTAIGTKAPNSSDSPGTDGNYHTYCLIPSS